MMLWKSSIPNRLDTSVKQRRVSSCQFKVPGETPHLKVFPCKMEDHFLEIVQPAHLKPFVPLAAQELQDHLHRMPRPIACWFASEFRYIVRECKKSWHWYYNRVHDLWLYLDSLDWVVSQYPHDPDRLPLTTYASREDANWIRANLMEGWGRLDCTAEALVWFQRRVHLPCWGLILTPAPVEGLHG